MSHLTIAYYATPEGHEQFINEVSHWKYPVEGNVRTGEIKPLIGEVKIYDIRIPEEVAPRLLRDIGVVGVQKKNAEGGKQGGWIIQKAINLFRKLTPWKKPVISEAEREHPILKGWHYAFVVGQVKDPKQKDRATKGYKEVL